jgi:hypothetical protein
LSPATIFPNKRKEKKRAEKDKMNMGIRRKKRGARR